MLQEKLNLLLTKYAVGTAAAIDGSGETVAIDGTVYPLLPHRVERRFTEMRKMLTDGTVNGLSALRAGRVDHPDVPLEKLVRRELDICRYLTGSEAVSLTAYVRDNRAANLIVNMASGVVCSIEVANTLPAYAQPVDKHEGIGSQGFVCDKVVDTQAQQSSIYLFAGDAETYTDVDFELYGLDADAVAAVRAAFALAKDAALREQTLADSAVLDRMMDAVKQSAATGKNVKL
ncbi:MAG: hypothetical protein IJ493_00790 [Clostridia bacterium]|nr:hypothetical protein [Clostridia bacterium]